MNKSWNLCVCVCNSKIIQISNKCHCHCSLAYISALNACLPDRPPACMYNWLDCLSACLPELWKSHHYISTTTTMTIKTDLKKKWNSVFNDLRVTSAVKSGRHFPRNVPSRSTFHSGEFCFKNLNNMSQSTTTINQTKPTRPPQNNNHNNLNLQTSLSKLIALFLSLSPCKPTHIYTTHLLYKWMTHFSSYFKKIMKT